MTVVQTVLGPVDSGDLGQVLTHEHLFVGWPGWQLDPIPPDQKVEQHDDLVAKLQRAHRAGVRTLVDASPAELGRDVSLLRRVSEETDLHIIASTGFYHEAWGLPVYLKMRSVEELTEILLHELTKGIGAERIRAGAIKIASSGATLGKHERKALLAAAAAARETGAPILTHASVPEVGLEQAEALVAEGIRPGSVQIGHCDGFPIEALERILQTGVVVAFDQAVYQQRVTLEQRVSSIATLLQNGWSNRITLSHDQLGIVGGRQIQVTAAVREFTYIQETLLPALRAVGVTAEQEACLTSSNAADWLGDHRSLGTGSV